MALNFPIKRVTRKVNKTKNNIGYQTIKKTQPKKDGEKNLRKANLGMVLEEMINDTNTYYLNNNIAVIHKKPTPIQIVKVDYPSRNKAVITEAYYKTPSTTDYNGIYKGKYIDFDAKECHSKTSFPLANIHPHQMSHLKSIIEHGGIGFMIVSWTRYNEYYLLPFEIAKSYFDNKDDGGRKSIPYEEFKNNCHKIKEGYIPALDYLKVVDEVYINNK